jgi:hypothetical protein
VGGLYLEKGSALFTKYDLPSRLEKKYYISHDSAFSSIDRKILIPLGFISRSY